MRSLITPVALWVVVLVLSMSAVAGAAQPQFVLEPVLTPNPNLAVPLAAIIDFETDIPTQAILTLDDGEQKWSVFAEPELKQQHSVMVLGVRPDRTHLIRVNAVSHNRQRVVSEPLEFTTPALPPNFAPITTTVSHPSKMAHGVTMFGARSNLGNPHFIVMLDHAGDVRWYYQADATDLVDIRRLRNGNLLYISGRQRATEIDMLGNVVQEWFASAIAAEEDIPEGATRIDTDSLHHEMFELPEAMDADFVGLSSELRVLSDYPANEVDQAITSPVANVVGDVIVEFRRDGTIVNQWSLLDILDPYRVNYDSLADFWNASYANVIGGQDTKDWSHANAVIYDPSDDTYIVSVRYQDAVIKFRRSDGGLVWILGDHSNWNNALSAYLLTPSIGTEWPYHQHAPMITSQGNILLFDNGNYKAVPPDPPLTDDVNWSRAVEFSIAPGAMTVEQTWSYGEAPDSTNPDNQTFYSRFLCDADELSNGNVLVTDGGRFKTIITPEGEISVGWARIAEVTKTNPPEIVFELTIEDNDTVQPISWSIYRSERLGGVYPHQ